MNVLVEEHESLPGSSETGTTDSANPAESLPTREEFCALAQGLPTKLCENFGFFFDDSMVYTSNAATLPSTLHTSDLATITPQPTSLRMEPNGWAILGKPVNFWTTATVHTKTTTLLGHQVTVTFTPTATTYTYGDGYTHTTTTAGASWDAQGLAELTDTATSHRYQAKATITATATVHYAASITTGNRTIPVTGTLRQATNPLTFTVYRSDTHLIPNQ